MRDSPTGRLRNRFALVLLLAALAVRAVVPQGYMFESTAPGTLPVAAADPPQLGIEFAVPLHQDLNGIQAPQDWKLSLGLSKAF